MMVEEGRAAPDVTLQATGGRSFSISAHRGRPLVVYFYPKADTSGCTKQACDFQEALTSFNSAGIDIVAISPDPLPALEKFAAKYGLQFPLASDHDKAAAQAYGTWVQKSMYGRSYMGMERATFLIDANGTLSRIWRRVRVPGHVKEVAAAAKALNNEASLRA
ncbi:peroxiredoxin [Pseudoroseomonas globiformis]|uniref:thioredoxin-dependent peroxiredoxin n=1 Tax=Teichococcus globiformis TaxID=2307229 RepID=A0ABV7G2G8_9PROT